MFERDLNMDHDLILTKLPLTTVGVDIPILESRYLHSFFEFFKASSFKLVLVQHKTDRWL